ncbi:hypothetical protein [Streptomyces sp. NPDC046925]|uniref:DNA polymerase Y family protein n=1 Tax=Streptomyces sp. NPDC046925 TaxID=3155375 RepID=UPI0033F729D6
MPAPPPQHAAGRRPRWVLRVRFDLAGHPEADAVFEQLLTLVADLTPVYQPYPQDYSVDLDVTGALRVFDRTAYELGQLLQLRAIAWYGVRTAAIGGGRSPLIAAMAAATSHGHVTVIAADDASVAAFLTPQPLTALPGIGPATARTLNRYGISTIGQLAATPAGPLARLLGAHAARELHTRARGLDDRTVQRTALIRSTSTNRAFDRDELDPAAHRRALLALADELGQRLRESGEVCRTLTLTVRYADRSHTTRSRTPAEPTSHSPALARTAYDIYQALGLQRARVRSLALRADLVPAAAAHHQLSLDAGDDKARRIESVADRARARFGPHAVKPATLATRRPPD